MATLQQAESHRRAVADLVALAARDVAGIWRSLDLDEPAAAAETLTRVMPDVTAAYANAAGGLAADWYEDLREESGAPGRFRAEVAGPPSTERAEVLARWAVGPLFGADPQPGVALSKLSGGLQRVVANGSRDTVVGNIRRDPGKARYVRHASASSCAFCRMLATRGAVYWSESSATKDYHDHCHCMAVPVWPGTPYEEPPEVEQWRQEYEAAAAEGGGTKAILSRMRKVGNQESTPRKRVFAPASPPNAADAGSRVSLVSETLSEANPNYYAKSDDKRYRANCTNCVATFEVRMRGEAGLAAAPVSEEAVRQGGVTISTFLDRWRGPDGEPPPLRYVGGVRDTTKIMRDQWGEGSRGFVFVKWKTGGGHVFSAYVENGKVHFVDPQNGKRYGNDVFQRVSKGGIRLVRSDDLTLVDPDGVFDE